MDDFHIGFGDDGDAQIIAQSLAADVAIFGPRDERPVTFAIHNTCDGVIGGLNAASHWRWLYIRHFWIAPDYRRGGLGRRLLDAVENEARARGCVGLYVDTFDERAEAFYSRCGFVRFGAIDNFPPGHLRRFLRKAF